MTFIAAVTSPWFVFLSCDLRVTAMRGARVVDQTDWAVKAMQFDTDEIVGYAGFARIGDQLTDEWLVETLSNVPPHDRLDVLAGAATTRFNRLGLLQAHAFLGVGFHYLRKKRFPHAWIVTNAWDDYERRYDPRMIDSGFAVHRLRLSGGRLSNVWTLGAEDESGIASHESLPVARDEIERLVRIDRANPKPIMECLARLNEDVSSLGDHIGASCVVTSLPRGADRDPGIVSFIEEPDLRSMQRFAVSANFVKDFRGVHADHFRQPGLISHLGFSVVGAVSASQSSEIGPDPHRFPGGKSGAAFGIRRS